MKKAFTLAELMIVLTVIGILAAILLPSAFQATPDQNVMKFKKANSMLGTIIRELVNSDRYYSDGDLGLKADGSDITDDDKTYFCESVADILNTRKVNCRDALNGGDGFVNVCGDGNSVTSVNCSANTSISDAIKQSFDAQCLAAQAQLGNEAEIVTADGVSWYQTNPSVHFGIRVNASAPAAGGGAASGGGSGAVDVEEVDEDDPSAGGGDDSDPIRRFSPPSAQTANFADKYGMDKMYKVYCIDVDDIGSGEDPFGYGIRADGRIIPGFRADEWINRKIQRED